MRHKYQTRGIVLSRLALGEANLQVAVITPELGLVRASAQGVRWPKARLASALATFAESELLLVRGKDRWRVAGAVLDHNWFARFATRASRERAGRVASLLLRLAADESPRDSLYPLVADFFAALTSAPEAVHEGAEIIAALRLLAALGLDDGALPSGDTFARAALETALEARTSYVARINRGIAASGL